MDSIDDLKMEDMELTSDASSRAASRSSTPPIESDPAMSDSTRSSRNDSHQLETAMINEEHADARPDLVDKFSVKLNVNKRAPNECPPSWFQVLDVTSDDGSEKEGLSELSEQMKNRVLDMSFDDGVWQVRPIIPFKEDPMYNEMRYTDFFFASDLAASLRKAEQEAESSYVSVSGQVNASRRRTGSPFAELLHVGYSNRNEYSMTHHSGKEGSYMLFNAQIVQSHAGPNDNVERVKFFKDQLEGRDCFITAESDDKQTCILRTFKKKPEEETTDFRTNQDFYNSLVGKPHKYSTGSAHGLIWPL